MLEKFENIVKIDIIIVDKHIKKVEMIINGIIIILKFILKIKK